MAVEDAREDTDVVVARESLAELGQELGGGLDAGPVVLVDDEEARPFGGGAIAHRSEG